MRFFSNLTKFYFILGLVAVLASCTKQEDSKIQLEKLSQQLKAKTITSDVVIMPIGPDYTRVCLKNPDNENVFASFNLSYSSVDKFNFRSCKFSWASDFLIIESKNSENIIVFSFNEKLKKFEHSKGIEYHQIGGIGRYIFGKTAIPFKQYIDNKIKEASDSSINTREDGSGPIKISCSNGGCGASECTYKSGEIASTGGAEGSVKCNTGYFACCNGTDDCKCIENSKGGCK